MHACAKTHVEKNFVYCYGVKLLLLLLFIEPHEVSDWIVARCSSLAIVSLWMCVSLHIYGNQYDAKCSFMMSLYDFMQITETLSIPRKVCILLIMPAHFLFTKKHTKPEIISTFLFPSFLRCMCIFVALFHKLWWNLMKIPAPYCDIFW